MLANINKWLNEPVISGNVNDWLNKPITSKDVNKWLNEPLILVNTNAIGHWARATSNKIAMKTDSKTTNAVQTSYKPHKDVSTPQTINNTTTSHKTQPQPFYEAKIESKANRFVQIQKPEYSYLKLIPMTSIRNYESDKIAGLVAALYKSVTSRISFADKKLNIEMASKVGYYIFIQKASVEFYFIVPNMYKNLIKERIADTWKGITIIETDSIPQIQDEKAVAYKLDYKQEDAFSLTTDTRTNTLLSSVLNVLNVIQNNDAIGICYNFMPANQYTWRSNYAQTIKKYKEGLPTEKEKFSGAYIFKTIAHLMVDILDIIFDTFGSVMGEVTEAKPNNINKKHKKSSSVSNDSLMQFISFSKTNELTPDTRKKRDAVVLRTQAVIISSSNSKSQAISNAKSVCQAFKTVTGDNELMAKPTKQPKALTDYSLTGETGMSMTPRECGSLIALPGYELLEAYKCIQKVDTIESEVPEELRNGVMCIGTNTYRGSQQRAYISTDRHLRNLALVLIGPTRAGKSTLITNLARDSINNNECTVMFDFCGNCQLSDEVSASISDTLNIKCDDFETLQGLGYNEIDAFPTSDPFMRYRNAKIQTSQLMTLVNGVNSSDKELSAKMDRYLESAALLTFIQNGSASDVFALLQNHEMRHEYIAGIPQDQHENLKEYVYSLLSLDERNREGEVVGTKYNLIAGIIDRINKLKQNTYMELMFKKDTKQNINLVSEIQKNQLICLRMPEIMFTTESEKDSYCTYWLTKIWLALQIRNWNLPAEEHIKVNIIVDELYQVPNTQELLRSKLSQMAKFTSKVIISCHYLGQIKIIRDELKAANSSYVMIAGCDKDNFNELKNELKPFELEDLLNLKRYHALNLLRYENGYACFITKLPNQLPSKKAGS